MKRLDEKTQYNDQYIVGEITKHSYNVSDINAKGEKGTIEYGYVLDRLTGSISYTVNVFDHCGELVIDDMYSQKWRAEKLIKSLKAL